MLASSALTSPHEFVNVKGEPMECGVSSPPAASISPKSTDENGSHYTATSSPSSTTNLNSHGSISTGSYAGTLSGGNATMSAGSSSASSSGTTNLESPRSSNDTSQRTSFDLNSMLAGASMNNNEDPKKLKTKCFLPFGMDQTVGAFESGSTLLQLSQMLGNNPGMHGGMSALAQSPFPPFRQQLDPLFLQQQLQQAALSRRGRGNLPPFQNGLVEGLALNGKPNENGPPGRPPPSNDAPQERKPRSYPYTFQFCVLCKKNVHSSKLPCHIRQMHIGKPMFRCPACDFTSTYSKNNVKSHMVSLHGMATEPISYMDQYAPQVEEFMKQCFPNVRGRGRPVHGRRSPRSPASPAVQPNGSPYPPVRPPTSNGRPAAKAGRQRCMPQTNTPTPLQPNRFNEMFAMLGSKMAAESKPEPVPQVNPLAYLQNLNNYWSQLAPLVMPKVTPPSVDAIKKEEPPSERISVEHLFNRLPVLQRPIKEETPSEVPATDEAAKEEEEEAGVVDDDDCYEPRYLPQNLKVLALDQLRIQNTVFSTFSNPLELVEKLDFSQFEGLINEPTTLLTAEQSQRVAAVREKLQVQHFEVEFAVHKLDLSVLPLWKLNLLLSIVPTELDVRRFDLFKQSNSVQDLSKEERFVSQLAGIERLREKLAVLSLMGTFDSCIQKLNQQIHDLTNASKMLHNSSEFHTIVQLLLICSNVINGDLNSGLLGGFRISTMGEMCAYKFPNGSTLMNFLAQRIHSNFPELKAFAAQHSSIEAAANTQFAQVLNETRGLEKAKQRVDAELRAIGASRANTDEELLKKLDAFHKHMERELTQLNESIEIAKDEIRSTLEFFGERVSGRSEEAMNPEEFFKNIAEFSRNLQASLCSM
ncbi:Formin-homology and zinc finger domains protein 1 [Aphelenchoides fujianensis]|nr:Formin-homology and zinc finger domains protein 1 [Aphelenchoides fujianensis]